MCGHPPPVKNNNNNNYYYYNYIFNSLLISSSRSSHARWSVVPHFVPLYQHCTRRLFVCHNASGMQEDSPFSHDRKSSEDFPHLLLLVSKLLCNHLPPHLIQIACSCITPSLFVLCCPIGRSQKSSSQEFDLWRKWDSLPKFIIITTIIDCVLSNAIVFLFKLLMALWENEFCRFVTSSLDLQRSEV